LLFGRSARSRSPPAQAANPRQISWLHAVIIGVFHLIALLAFFPWFFSWTGLILAYLGRYVFAPSASIFVTTGF